MKPEFEYWKAIRLRVSPLFYKFQHVMIGSKFDELAKSNPEPLNLGKTYEFSTLKWWGGGRWDLFEKAATQTLRYM